MGKIIVNKHFSNIFDITPDKFDSQYGKGEIIISNEVGLEGLYILNDKGDVININGADSGTSAITIDVVMRKVKEYLEIYYANSADTVGAINEVSGKISSLSGSVTDNYATSADTSDAIKDVSSKFADYATSASTVSSIEAAKVESIQSGKTYTDAVKEELKKLIDDIQIEAGHVALTQAQYTTLITEGKVVVEGREITYNPNIYYMIYEDDESGTTVDGSAAVIDSANPDTMIVINAYTDSEDESLLVIPGAFVTDDDTLDFVGISPSKQESVVEGDSLIMNKASYDEDEETLTIWSNTAYDAENNILEIQ